MKSGVLDQSDPLAPAVDVDQGGPSGDFAAKQAQIRADMVLCDTCFSAYVVGSVLPSFWRHGNHAVAVGSRRGCRPVEGTAAQNRAGTSYRRPSSQSWVAIWHPLPLKLRIRSYKPI